MSETPKSAFCGAHCTHVFRRADAVIHNGREFVPSIWGKKDGTNTVYVDSLDQLRAAKGGVCFNEDQTEIYLRLPVGHKFSIKMFEPTENIIRAYQQLHDGLSDMIEEGRLTESAIPDDYKWLVDSLEQVGNLPGNEPTKEDTRIRQANRAE